MRRRLMNFLRSQMKEEIKPEVPAILLPPETEKKTAPSCSKCGKEMTRGLYMHEKHCKGA